MISYCFLNDLLCQLSYVIMKGLVSIIITDHNKLMPGSPSHLRDAEGLSQVAVSRQQCKAEMCNDLMAVKQA